MCVFLFSSVELLISFFARSFKEAQILSLPLMMLVLIPFYFVIREATICKMSWEARFVLKMKADLPEKPMDTEPLERICMETRETYKCLVIRLPER